MNIKIGDKVKFLNEKGEGIVTRIINKHSVGVTIEDGFELPFSISELLVISDQLESINDPINHVSTLELKSIKKNINPITKGIVLAITPEKLNDIIESDFNVWLINNTEYTITFSVSIIKQNGVETINVLSIEAFQTSLIETIDKKKLSDFNNLKIDILFHNKKLHQNQPPVSEIVKLKTAKFYKENTFIENEFIEQKAFTISIWNGYKEEEPKEVPETGTIDFSKFLFQKQTTTNIVKKSKPNKIQSELEIDLHIEEVLEDYRGMSNAQIIEAQLNYLQKALNKAIEGKYKRLIIIHGVGNGRLKTEVRAILNSYSIKYYDASYAKYGYGATEGIINH